MKTPFGHLVLVLLLVGSISAYSQDYRIKATLIRQFCKYLNWPTAKETITIGAIGNSPVFDELLQMSKGTNLTVVKLDMESLLKCDMLFIPASQDEYFDLILSKISQSPIVTITETVMLAEKGSAFTFYLDGDKLRFVLNKKALDRQNIKVSSTLISLAKVI